MIKLKEYLKILIGILFIFSSALLSIQLIVKNYYTMPNIIITVIVTIIVATYFYIKTHKENYKTIKNNRGFTIISIGLVSIVMLQLYLTKSVECKELFTDWRINVFRIRFFLMSYISAIYIGIYILNKIKIWILDFYNMLDNWDKKAYIVFSIISIFIIIIAYNSNSNWYLQYDKVYSLDSGWCFENIFPKSTYYDIRHPLINFLVFPIWAIVYTVINFIVTGNLSIVVLAIVIQIINAQFLILTGLQLKILSKKRIVLITYMLSFPTILYIVFFEKYQICTFLVVLYVFTICNKKEESIPSLIAGTGALPTSCVIGLAEIFTKDKINEKLEKILKIILSTLIIFICLGRGHILKSGLSEMLITKKSFSNERYTIEEKVNSTTQMIKNSFCALRSENIKGNIYWWIDIKAKASIFAICIIILILIGVTAKRKELFAKICAVWVAFAFVLFVILNWSTQESPLFSIYFSWAIIPLAISGLDWILERTRLNKKTIYAIGLILITVINVSAMFDINMFMKGI